MEDRSTTRASSWRYVWASPATLLGLALAALNWPDGRLAVVDGVVEVHGARLRWALTHLLPVPGGAAAITLGHVVLGCDARALDETRAHERTHVRQYERWGPFFVPLYLAASAWAALRGRHFYFDNPFEREAMKDGQETSSAVTPAARGATPSDPAPTPAALAEARALQPEDRAARL